MDTPLRQEGVFVFEDCRLDPVSRTLTQRGVRVPLPARLFDTLLYLVENHGRLIARDELIAAVWTGRAVDEGSLGRAISSLRVALKGVGLADTLIVTVTGRGYRFGARVHFEAAATLHTAGPQAPQMQAGMLGHVQPAASQRGFRVSGAAAAAAAVLATIALVCLWIVSPSNDHSATHYNAAFAPPPHSVAVLPFTNTSSDPGQAYLSDGMSEELINALGRIDTLRVAARMSSFSFKGKQATIRDIAQELNVGMVLEGSVQRIGTHVHLTTQLIDGATGYQVWSRRYDGDQTDILSLEAQVAEEVITSLKGVLLDDDLAKLALGSTSNAKAFDAYLSGISAMSRADYAGYRRAVLAFNTATTADPGYAAAYVARARALALAAVMSVGDDAKLASAQLDAALHDAETALAMAPKLGAAHAAVALVLKYRLSDMGRAASEYVRAVELSPDDSATLSSYASFQRDIGNFTAAVAAARRAVALDPLKAMQYRSLAQDLAYAGQYDEAMVALRHAENLPPADPALDRIVLSLIQLLKGDAAGARQTCSVSEDYRSLGCLALAEVALGNGAAAQQAVSRLKAMVGDSGAYEFAMIYAAWGRKEQSLIWLQKAYDLRDPGLAGIKIDPPLQSIRGTPTYKEIVHRLGFSS